MELFKCSKSIFDVTIIWCCLPETVHNFKTSEPRVPRDTHCSNVFDVTLYANILFVCCIFSACYFWLLGFPSTGEVLAINNVTWYVNESCQICFLHKHIPFLYQDTPVLFYLLNWNDRVANEKDIYRVYKIIVILTPFKI